MKQFVRNLILKIFSIGNFDRLFLNRQPRVLFYHGVDDKIADAAVETESISSVDFEKQLKYIKKHFLPIALDEFYTRYVNNSWEGREILLTFDDGYRNLLTDGLPLLVKYEIPFALFITTDNITNNSLFPTTINRLVNLNVKGDIAETEHVSRLMKTEPVGTVNELCKGLLSQISNNQIVELRKRYSSVNPMNWEEVMQIAQSPLCTIGSHCVTHICCHGRQESDEIRRQLSDSKREIERHLGQTCDFLAWPNGSFTSEAEKIARECGYKMAFSTKYRPVSAGSLFSVGRIQIPYDYARFKYAISRFPG